MEGKAVMLERVPCGARSISEDDEGAKAGICRRRWRRR